MTDYNDPYEAASNPEQPTMEAWGLIKVDASFVVLEKGVGALPFDPAVNKPEERRTNIALDIAPIPEMDLKFTILRKVLRESREWAAIVWPSLKALGINNLREINNRWVRAEQASTGRAYTNRSGETVQATTFKFLEIFPDEASCRAAYVAKHGGTTSGITPDTGQVPAATTTQQATPPAGSNGTANEKAVALRLVEALVRKTDGDETALAAKIAEMPVLARHFTAQSPEVRALIDAHLLQKAPF